MNTKAEREKMIAWASYRIEHTDRARPWFVTNRAQVIKAVMKKFRISEKRAETVVFHASTRQTSVIVKTLRLVGLWEED